MAEKPHDLPPARGEPGQPAWGSAPVPKSEKQVYRCPGDGEGGYPGSSKENTMFFLWLLVLVRLSVLNDAPGTGEGDLHASTHLNTTLF